LLLKAVHQMSELTGLLRVDAAAVKEFAKHILIGVDVDAAFP
jgi:hypothetical protein